MDYQTEDTERTAVDANAPPEIERLARIAIESGEFTDDGTRPEHQQLLAAIPVVRAILTAMRSPVSYVHFSDCAQNLAPAYDPEECDCGSRDCWQMMIDHLLTDGDAKQSSTKTPTDTTV